MEDADDKIRRNLMAFSLAVILFWFFDLKLASDTKIFGIASVGAVSQFKLWLSSTAILVYFGLRYRFDKPTRQRFINIRDEMKGIATSALRKQLIQGIEEQVKMQGRTEGLRISFSENQHSTTNFANLMGGSSVPVSAFSVVDMYPVSYWRGTGRVVFDFTTAAIEGRPGTRYILDCDYLIKGIHRYRSFLVTVMRTTFYSASAVEVLYPVILATMALIICFAKLFTV